MRRQPDAVEVRGSGQRVLADLVSLIPFAALILLLYLTGREILLAGNKARRANSESA